jgi:SAM-dependent methyltransferase
MIRCPGCALLFSFTTTSCPQCLFSPEIITGFPAWAPHLAFESEGFNSNYFNDLSLLEKNNFWFRARNALIIWAIKKYFPNFNSFLEIGCGTGFVLSEIATRFPNTKTLGTEVFVEGLKFAHARVTNGHFMQMDARHIPFENEFDLIGSFDVLEHIEEDQSVLSNMYKAIKPGGGLMISVPQHPWLWSTADDFACHVRRYTAKEITSKIKQAGFNILRNTSFVSFLLPAMFLSRAKHRGKQNYNLESEFNISSVLNRTLETILTVERQFIRMGISFPLGGSRFIVAKKY